MPLNHGVQPVASRTRWQKTLLVLLVGLSICFPLAVVIQSQTTQYSLAEILNLVYDPDTNSLRGVPGVVAQTTHLTPAEIFNLVFLRDENRLNITGGGGGGTITSHGLKFDADGINGIKFNANDITQSGPAGQRSYNRVVVGTPGVNIILPDLSAAATLGYYKFKIIDTGTGLLTLTPFSESQTINGIAGTHSPGLTGKGSYYRVEKIDDVDWEVEGLTTVGYGEPVTNLCTAVGGSTNADTTGSGSFHNHTLTCTVPAGATKTGTVLDFCHTLELTTAAAAGTLHFGLMLDEGDVALQGTAVNSQVQPALSQTNKSLSLCFDITFGAISGNNIELFAAIRSDWAALASTVGLGGQNNPTSVDRTLAMTFVFQSKWNSNETGENKVEQQAMRMNGARFAQ